MGDRFFSRNQKYSIQFNKDSTKAELLKVSRWENTPTIIKKYELRNEEFSPNKFHREKQLYKHILGDALKNKKLTMKELNEFAMKHKLISGIGLMIDTLSTKVED